MANSPEHQQSVKWQESSQSRSSHRNSMVKECKSLASFSPVFPVFTVYARGVKQALNEKHRRQDRFMQEKLQNKYKVILHRKNLKKHQNRIFILI